MKLIERADFLAILNATFENVNKKEGRCILITGEAGMGKTALTKAFCSGLAENCQVYQGTCDAFSTPHVLAPLFDISVQMENEDIVKSCEATDPMLLFVKILKVLNCARKPVILVIEDIQWADKHTLGFIKFLARRISDAPCMLILTCRDNEAPAGRPLTTVLGDLSREALTRITLPPLSAPAVNDMAVTAGYNGDDIFHLTGGNPFYVNEILGAKNPGVPDNVRDTVLAVYSQQPDITRHVWDILSTSNAGLETIYIEKIFPDYNQAIKASLDAKILVLSDGKIFFKYELYRRTIEAALSPLVRIDLNRQVLNACIKEPGQKCETRRILHYAKEAHRDDLVYQYAVLAAKRADLKGAHAEAAKLYRLAIDCNYHPDEEQANGLYELYAHACYLAGDCRHAISYIEKALNFWKDKQNPEKTAACTLLLSKLWRSEGDRLLAEKLGNTAVNMVDSSTPAKLKTLTYENMAQLSLSAGRPGESLEWGHQAHAAATGIGEPQMIFQARLRIGAARMSITTSFTKGKAILLETLDTALKNSYCGHAAHIYCILAVNGILANDYIFAKKIINDGISYCCERGLEPVSLYLQVWKSRLCLETGEWDNACAIAGALLKNDDLPPAIKVCALCLTATLKLRRAEQGALPLLLQAKSMAFDTLMHPGLLFVSVGLLEYEWLTGENLLHQKDIASLLDTITQREKLNGINRLHYWLKKTQKDYLLSGETTDRPFSSPADRTFGAPVGGSFEHAIDLFEGGESDKRKAMVLVQKLGAVAVCEKLRREMRKAGIKNIPQGQRKVTLANPAWLTERELDVLQLLKKGLLNKEIAESLFIASKTVGHHISAILTKLDVNSRGKAVQKALSLNI